MSSSNFLSGFSAELEKLGGIGSLIGAALKPAAKLVAKHPFATIFGAVPAVVGASKAFAKGVSGPAVDPGGEPEHVLAATPGHPSEYSDVNFHDLIPHKLQPWEKFRISRNYPAYRRGIGAAK